ncbi:MAG: hypothetical protein NC132_04495 [Corallococcus sp.]|nr:hypothetical protein [Corallococcus sp.]MCM1359645.1 hypothetical protein [Corallococcus sp.]MCM1395354.1 hypothetical protein [Corallococcus sp.]
MKWKEIFADAATVVGCCVGAGFLSGKEAQLYFGNPLCACIFAVTFCVLVFCVRSFCAKMRCSDVASLCKTCYGSAGHVLAALACACCFVCIVAMIAGSNVCLSALLLPKFEPFYGVIVGVMSVLVVKKGLRALKMLNILSLLLAAVYLVWLFAESKATDFVPQPIHPFSPIVYATFSLTTSLGVLTKLSQTDKRSNAAATLICSALLLALAFVVMRLCNFDMELPLLCRTKNAALNAMGGIAVVCATVTGVSANAIPLSESLKDVFDGDDVLCLLTLFCTAVAMSLIGVDVVMKWGYFAVAGVGAVIVAGCLNRFVSDARIMRKRRVKTKT